MNLLTMKNIHKAYTDKVLFKGADFSVNSGDKIGVIGITGKSTLLKMIAGLDTCDAGLVVRGNNIVVNYLPQSPTFDDNETIYEHVITANSTEENKWSIEGDARAILDQLGFNDTGIPVSTLSGGQKKKVALAAALLSNCDILVLDEPTNHLKQTMKASLPLRQNGKISLWPLRENTRQSFVKSLHGSNAAQEPEAPNKKHILSDLKFYPPRNRSRWINPLP